MHEEFGDGEGGDFAGVVRARGRGGGGGGGCGGRGRRGRVGGGEGEEDGVGVAGAVGGVGVGAEGEGVEDGLEVVFLDAGEERFVGGGVVREGGGDGGDVGPVDVFGGDEAEAVFAEGLWRRLLRRVEFGFPHHVADAVADLQEHFDDVGCEGGGVEG